VELASVEVTTHLTSLHIIWLRVPDQDAASPLLRPARFEIRDDVDLGIMR
jgi:hypothetical protein